MLLISSPLHASYRCAPEGLWAIINRCDAISFLNSLLVSNVAHIPWQNAYFASSESLHDTSTSGSLLAKIKMELFVRGYFLYFTKGTIIIDTREMQIFKFRLGSENRYFGSFTSCFWKKEKPWWQILKIVKSFGTFLFSKYCDFQIEYYWQDKIKK